MSFSVVQNLPEDGGSAPFTAIYGSAQTAGNLNLVLYASDNVGSPNTPTDTAGNSYTPVTSVAANGVRMHAWVCPSIHSALAGANTVTLTYTGAPSFPELWIFEISGCATSSPVDQSAIATAASSATADSGNTPTTTNANDFLIGYCFTLGNSSSAGSTYTIIGSITGFGALAEQKTVSSTGAFNATTNLSGPAAWAQLVIALKSLGAGGGSVAFVAGRVPAVGRVRVQGRGGV